MDKKVSGYLQAVWNAQIAIPVGFAISSVEYTITQENPAWRELVNQLLGSLFLLLPYLLASTLCSFLIVFPLTVLLARLKILNSYVIAVVSILTCAAIVYSGGAHILFVSFIIIGAAVYWYTLKSKKLLTSIGGS